MNLNKEPRSRELLPCPTPHHVGGQFGHLIRRGRARITEASLQQLFCLYISTFCSSFCLLAAPPTPHSSSFSETQYHDASQQIRRPSSFSPHRLPTGSSGADEAATVTSGSHVCPGRPASRQAAGPGVAEPRSLRPDGQHRGVSFGKSPIMHRQRTREKHRVEVLRNRC